MSGRDKFLASIATTIKTYREGEVPQLTPAHVDRWANQFSPADQLPFLREFDHVIRQTFLTMKSVKTFLSKLVQSPKLAGANPIAYWARANILRIQKAGQSQKEMVKLFAGALEQQCGLKITDCGAEDGDYIYLDDVLFTGQRIAADLEAWIAQEAPAKAKVHVILMALHTSGHYWISSKRLKQAVGNSGKNITIKFWYLLKLENQRDRKDDRPRRFRTILLFRPTSLPKSATRSSREPPAVRWACSHPKPAGSSWNASFL